MAEQRSEPDGMAPLQRLIVERMREQGWEPKDIEARGVKHATLHRYMKPVRLKNLPRQEVLQTLATALTLNYDAVLEAAMGSVGWDGTGARVVRLHGSLDDADGEPRPVGRTRDPDAMLALDDMTPEQRAQVRAYAEFIRSQNPAAQ